MKFFLGPALQALLKTLVVWLLVRILNVLANCFDFYFFFVFINSINVIEKDIPAVVTGLLCALISLYFSNSLKLKLAVL
jgi:hypothetical protein